jgi:hypothetical protein
VTSESFLIVDTELVEELPAVTNKNVPYRAHKSPPLGPILIHLYSVQDLHPVPLTPRNNIYTSLISPMRIERLDCVTKFCQLRSTLLCRIYVYYYGI